MVTCPDEVNTSNMPALVEDTRPDPAVEYQQERQQNAYNELMFHRLQLQRAMVIVNFNQNVAMEEVN